MHSFPHMRDSFNMEMLLREGWAALGWQKQQSLPCTDVLFRSESASSPQSEKSLGPWTKHAAVRSLLRELAAAQWNIPAHFRTLYWTAFHLPAQNWRVLSGKHRQGRECWWGSWCCRRRFSVGARNMTQDPAWTRKLRGCNGWKEKLKAMLIG